MIKFMSLHITFSIWWSFFNHSTKTMHDVRVYVKKTSNLTEEEIDFDVNLKFDESSFEESLDERLKILTSEVVQLHCAFNHVK